MKYDIRADTKEQQQLAQNPKGLEKKSSIFLVVFWHFESLFIPFNPAVGKTLKFTFCLLQHLTHLCEFHLTNEWKQCANISRRGLGLYFEERRKRQWTCKNNMTHCNTNPRPKTSTNHLTHIWPLTWPLWHHYPRSWTFQLGFVSLWHTCVCMCLNVR